MIKDPAFLFYDGDAARDVSHMNRLERGCYFDLIQAQRKFGGYTTEQARKILGKDFETCWDAISLILKNENEVFFIEWVKDSIGKRKEHAEKQRIRIQDYWDKKKKEDIPELYHGITTVIPLVNENENVIIKSLIVSFENFWNLYDIEEDKIQCETLWMQLENSERIECITKLPEYIKSTPDKQYRKSPKQFIKNKSWRNEIIKRNGSNTPELITPKFSSGPGR